MKPGAWLCMVDLALPHPRRQTGPGHVDGTL